MARPAVFLDRDGVLNEVRFYNGVASTPRRIDDLVIAPSAAGELARLRAAGFALIVVSNQPDVARGGLQADELDGMHDALCEVLPLDAVYVCPHDRQDGCGCRKPKPGLIHRAATDWGIDLGTSWMVGDRWVDLAAARAAGIEPILLECPWSWRPTSEGSPPPDLAPRFQGASLGACVEFILGDRSRGASGPKN